jgi:tetratricopeptide (TPR) repeat protein
VTRLVPSGRSPPWARPPSSGLRRGSTRGGPSTRARWRQTARLRSEGRLGGPGWRLRTAAAAAAASTSSRAAAPAPERPDLIAGAIANRTGRHERARTALLRAVDRNPVNWYARFELAVAESELGRPGDAREELQRARALNPYEDVIEHAEESLAGGDSIPLDEIDSVFRERLETRTR